jgi:hypothetical protein
MMNDSDVRARMAARDTASLVGANISATADQDQVAAMSRIIGDLNVPIMGALQAYKRLLAQLQGADLTMNFIAYKFFNKKPEGEKYVSQFEGGNTWGDPTYMQMRDEAEEAMFDYAGTGPALAGNFGAAKARVKTTGDRGSNAFDGMIRPKYAALNYANLAYGSAAQWGKSYMILKEYVKQGATYVHTDSFDCAGSARQRATLRNQVANYFNMQRLLVNMAPGMLSALDQASRGQNFGQATQPPNVGNTAYVEAHCHSEIRFDRDLAALVINTDEMNESEAKTTVLHQGDAKRWKVMKPKGVKKRFEAFADTYGITLRYS